MLDLLLELSQRDDLVPHRVRIPHRSGLAGCWRNLWLLCGADSDWLPRGHYLAVLSIQLLKTRAILVRLFVLKNLDLGMNLLEGLLILWREYEVSDVPELLLGNGDHHPR